jgi:FkbM family methyltransferase
MEWQEVDIFGTRHRVAGHSDDKTFLNLKDAVGQHRTLAELSAAILSPDSQACDVGANLGLTSLIIAKHVPAGKVYAFEPGKRTCSCLSATIAASGYQNVSITGQAVGAVSDQVFLHAGENFSAGKHVVTNQHVSNGALPTDSVRMNTLDSFLASAGAEKIDLIKIDTEGFEIDVLVGAKSTLVQYRPVVFLEMNSWCLIAFRNMNPRSFLESLLHGFPFVFWVTPSGKLRRIGSGVSMHHFLHEHLVRHGCINDLVCCWQTDWLGKFAPGLE